jgi:hypothetical protein
MSIKGGLSSRENQQKREGEKKRVLYGEREVHGVYIYTYIYMDSILTPTKHCLKGGEDRRGLR